MKYSDLKHVLDENRAIFQKIADHARGGSAPVFEGFNFPRALTETLDARGVSRELVSAIKPLRKELQKWDQWEQSLNQKRPQDALRSHVETSSTFIAHYVGRFVWMQEQQG